MRLVPLLLSLSGAVAFAQGQVLPWIKEPAPAWRAAPPAAPASALPPAVAKDRSLQVLLGPEGSLKVYDGRGRLKLRTGLPGRPLRVWRDGGIPVESWEAPLAFPARAPFGRGLGAWPMGGGDFRQGLEGLLWVLEDGERHLSVVYPGAAQVVHLALPPCETPELRFLEGGLELRSGRSAWTLPWVSLLPQFIRLATPAPAPPTGTAVAVFPRE